MRQFILLFGIVLTGFTSQAQTECSQYHKKSCSDSEGMFMKYDSQSKSAIMAKGQTSEFHVVAYNGQDYRVTVCNEENLGGEIKYKIYEKRKVLIKPKVDEYVEEPAANESSDESSDDYSSDDYSEDSYSEDLYSEETVTETGSNRPQFKLVKDLLYDNSQDSYSPFIEFTAEGSMSLIVEVSVPGEESKMKLKVRETGCVGVLIEHVKSQKTGF
tara:strand:+ start:67 stop:711 length:645 start_codon:yes stop_codon:yes gene_type:complete